MSINDIQLNGRQLAQLYKQEIVLVPGGDTQPVGKPLPERLSIDVSKSGAPSVPDGSLSGTVPAGNIPPGNVPADSNDMAAAPSVPGSVPPNVPPVKLLGNFSGKILVVVHYPNEAHLPEEQLGFLTNILLACRLSLEEVGILNLARHNGLTYQRIKEELSPACQIWLGITSQALDAPFRLEEYELHTMDGARFVSAPPLEAMNQASEPARAMKGKLWLNLKKMFQL